MAKCNICTKNTAVSLYVRVKPVWMTESGKLKAPKGEAHKFFGYWPPESHLAQYFRVELARKESILQEFFLNNCRGHEFDEITEAIEQTIPPIPGVPIKILWNPSPKVTPYLLAETKAEREEIELAINNDLRSITVRTKADIKTSLKALFNNTAPETINIVSYRPILPSRNGSFAHWSPL